VRRIVPDVIAWLGEGKPVALARVVEVVGSGVQPAGAALAVSASGQVAGSASGGCVEGALVEQTRAALEDDGRPRLSTFGCTDDEAFDVGLTCGGMVRVLIERLEPSLVRPPAAGRPEAGSPEAGGPGAGRPGVGSPETGRPVSWLDALAQALRSGVGAALVEVVDGPEDRLGSKAVVAQDRSGVISAGEAAAFEPEVLADALADLVAGRSATHRYQARRQPGEAEETVFVDSFASPPRMVIFGAASFTAALTAQAKLLGYHVVVCDARAVFASKARFPLADEVVVDWPDRYLARHGADLGQRDAICVLNHDPKFDLPAIMGALATGAGYIGAMGSRRTQAARWRRLTEAGASEADLRRIRGPLGLDLGAGSPEETAMSICAEIVVARTGRSGAPLASQAGPIHWARPEAPSPGSEPPEARPPEARPHGAQAPGSPPPEAPPLRSQPPGARLSGDQSTEVQL
jgi:xanthine dehydrogenase accessory factor